MVQKLFGLNPEQKAGGNEVMYPASALPKREGQHVSESSSDKAMKDLNDAEVNGRASRKLTCERSTKLNILGKRASRQ